jgi:hypothetical protein
VIKIARVLEIIGKAGDNHHRWKFKLLQLEVSMTLNKIVLTETGEILEENVPEEETVECLKEWEELFDGRTAVHALPMEIGQIKAA